MSDCGQCGKAVCDCYLDIGQIPVQTAKAMQSHVDLADTERWFRNGARVLGPLSPVSLLDATDTLHTRPKRSPPACG